MLGGKNPNLSEEFFPVRGIYIQEAQLYKAEAPVPARQKQL